jgi:hypothetical protein
VPGFAIPKERVRGAASVVAPTERARLVRSWPCACDGSCDWP